MKFEIAHREILEYLDKYGQVNTFRLSRDLKINRAKLIKLIKELIKKGLVEFKHGVVIKVKKKEQEGQKITKAKDVVSFTRKKPKIPKEVYSKLEKVKRKIQRLKRESKDLQTQKNNIAQKLAEERKQLNQTQKEREGAERGLAEREASLRQREESVSAALKKLKEDKALLDKERESIGQKINEAMELEKEKIAKARKRLRKEREQISKARVLKENINKLEATLEDLKKRIGIEKGKLKKLKEKEVRTKIIPKKIEKPKEMKPKPTLKPKIEKPIKKIKVSTTETEQPKIMPEEQLQPAIETEENVYDKFHNLIENEIDLLKQKKIYEARNIHFQIKDMINEVVDPDQRKIIVRDWNRIKDFC